MLLRTVATRYAQAIYRLAASKKRIDEQLQELIRVRTIFEQHPSLKRAMQSPTVPVSVKKRILKELLTKHVSPTTLHFLFVLVDKSREVYIDLIIESYREIQRAEAGVVRCHVESKTELSTKLQAQLEKHLESYTGQKVELVVEENPQMLGGMIIRVGDRVIDGSLDSQLGDIQERLMKAGSQFVGGF